MHAETATARPQHAGARTRRLRASHSYGFVLVLVLASFVIAASAEGDVGASVLLLTYCACLVTALWTSGLTPLRSRPTAILAAFGAVAAVVQLLTGGDRAAGVVAVLTGALIVATIVVVARGVADQDAVNAQSVIGAICVYVLLGLLFVFVYGALALFGDGSFFAQGTDGSRPLRVYFSFVTLATLGYGDYTPAGDLGRTVAIVEALLGQLYLVTVVALLVSRVARRAASPREDDVERAGPA